MSSASSFAALKAQRDARRNPFTAAAAGDMGPPAPPSSAAVPTPTSSRQPQTAPISTHDATGTDIQDGISQRAPPSIPAQRAQNQKPEPGAAGSRVRLPDIQDLELRFDVYSSERALFYAPLPKNGPRPADFSTPSSSSAFSPANTSRSLSGSLSYSSSQLLSSSYSAPGGWAAAGISSCRPGDVLLRVRPEVAVLSTALLDQRCSACYSPPISDASAAGKLQRCSACKVIRYCSSACQKRDWPAHRDECKALKAIQQLHTYRTALRQQRELDKRLASRFTQSQAANMPFGVGSFQDNDEVMAPAAATGHRQGNDSDGEEDFASSQDRLRLPSSMMRALARWIWARSRVGTGGKDKVRGDGGDLLELCSHRERFAPEQLQQQAQLAIHLAQYLTAAARATATFAPVSKGGEANLDDVMQPDATFSQGDALRTLGIDSATELLDLVCQFSSNSFTLTDSDLNPLGVCMHASMAMINHSCTPNAAVVFPFGGAAKSGQQKWRDGEDKIMQLVALRAIEPGEELLISYVDIADTYEERRSYLKKRYCFDCRCDLCRQSHAKLSPVSSQHPFASPLSSSSSSYQGFGVRPPQPSNWIDPRRAVWCPQRCGGWIDGSPFESQVNVAAKCNKCHLLSNLTPSDVAEDTRQAREVLAQASQVSARGQAEAAWTRCASVLPLLVERYPPSWQPLFQLLRLATTCLIEAGSSLLTQPSELASNIEAAVYCFDEAVRMQMMVVAGTQASSTPIYPKGHPARAIAVATLAKLVLAQFDHPHRLDSQRTNEEALQTGTAVNVPVCRAAVEQTAAQGGTTLSILRDPPSVPHEMRVELAKQVLTQAIDELDIGFGRSNQGGCTGREMRTALNGMQTELAMLAAQTSSLSVS
ncbi:hypothetical protein EX895_001175 [Sporisorium graminicola]|uniref:MYND-type domain-containing protein n=1 Tax=Sporisorium graminicola TaxID=280036 RepID=A0A4U7L244_9BASI|nr:hypothetical protein EX895_001175 [Sporisorium graminicola]TKY89878.1 hypothetical protein EX895_001175 [Sporisorium graminicola]